MRLKHSFNDIADQNVFNLSNLGYEHSVEANKKKWT
jgi:hypothetical protein